MPDFESLLSPVFARLRCDRSGAYVDSRVHIHPYELVYMTEVHEGFEHVWQYDIHRVRSEHGNRHWTLCQHDNSWFADGNFAWV